MLLMAECALFVNIKRTRTAHILPLFSTEIRRRIVDLYLSGRDLGQSHEQFVLIMAESALFVNIKRTRTAHILPLIKEDEEILLNFQTTL